LYTEAGLCPAFFVFPHMIITFTDFGSSGPYLGQMKAALYSHAPDEPVFDLFTDLTPYDVEGAAYLLAAYSTAFPAGSLFLAVVDPGVGSQRAAVVVQADGRWFVGPGNGLFNVIGQRASSLRCWEIDWKPESLSASFHGRDLFAPVAARIALGAEVPGKEMDAALCLDESWPADLMRVVYVDRYGNLITGLRAESVGQSAILTCGGRELMRRRTFSDVPPGSVFWYENSNGLVEIAVNQGRAADVLGLGVGAPIAVV